MAGRKKMQFIEIDGVKHKKCTACGEIKPITEYNIRGTYSNGDPQYNSRCRRCSKFKLEKKKVEHTTYLRYMGREEKIVDVDVVGEVVFMAVSSDEKELPLFVTSSKQELLEWTGLTLTALNTALYDKRASFRGGTRGYRVLAVKLDHKEED